jgi:AAA domain/RepB DNA-primase from phage plasmid
MNAPAHIPQPNSAQINEQLYTLFDPAFVNLYPDACVEIAYSHPSNGKLDEAKVFSAFELKEAAEFAAMKNAAGYNVYAAPALRTYGPREVPPDRRAKVENYLASAFAWADFDSAGDAERIEALLQQHDLKPAVVVTTGTVPHRRAQLLFRVSDIKDAEHQKQINEALQKLLDTDPNVVSAIQVMRLGGSVSYPPEKKVQRGYVVELTKLHKLADAPTYNAAQLLALGGVAKPEQTDPLAAFAELYGPKTGKSDEELIALLKQSRATPGKGWREPMVKGFIASTVGKGWPDLAIKLACAPYSDGGVDDPEIQKEVDYARKKFGKPDNSGTDYCGAGATAESKSPGSALPLTYFGGFGNKAKKRPILKGFLNKGETSSLIGPPKSLKSGLMAEIALHCAAGQDWRGHSATEPCGVVIIALERADLYRRRLDAYAQRDGYKDLPVAVAGAVIDLLNPKCVQTIVATVQEAEQNLGRAVGLIVIDTFSKGIAAGGGDEDKAKDQNRVAANLRRVQALIDVHIACVGHTGKDEGRGARGSNAHLGDIDLMIQISGDKIKSAKVTAANDQPERVLAQFQAELVDVGVDEDGEVETVAIVSNEEVSSTDTGGGKLSDTQLVALEQLWECIADGEMSPRPNDVHVPPNAKGTTLATWRKRLAAKGVINPEGNPHEQFKRIHMKLQKLKKIGVWEGFVWAVT